MNNKALLVFAKAPLAGYAKTRLIPELGAEGAAKLHAMLVRHTLQNVVDAEKWDTQLWCADFPEQTFFQQCANEFELNLFQQQGRNLGERMYHAIHQSLRRYKSVVLIGTDCPLLNREKIRAAFDDLTRQALVITPAEDGGYVLIGATQIESYLFENVTWGSASVMSQTLHNLGESQTKVILHPTLWDVDFPEDLSRLRALPPFNQALAISWPPE